MAICLTYLIFKFLSKVDYLDFGYTDIVTMKEMFPIKRAFLNVSSQNISFELADANPSENVNMKQLLSSFDVFIGFVKCINLEKHLELLVFGLTMHDKKLQYINNLI